jgi:hypothetical protein
VQLAATAADHGLNATRRLITDWVSLGLIDRPHHAGRGQGRGSLKGTWPYEQACLFVDLLTLRQRAEKPVKQVAGLANVPVTAWLWAGEGSGVPLRQVRRALATWCGRHRSRKHVGAARARAIAREMVKQIDNPRASRQDRESLRQLLSTSIIEGAIDPESVRVAVQRVFDPLEVGRELGPGDAPLTAESYARLLEGQASGYLNLERFSDAQFEDARIIYRQTRIEYAQNQPRYALDQAGSPFRFDAPTVESVINDACPNLLLILGMGRLAPARQEQLASEARQFETTRQGSPQPISH